MSRIPILLRAKCIVVGDHGVGKSAITQVFHSDGSHFPKNYNMTAGVEVCTKSVSVPETPDSVELFLYDSAGKEVYSEQVQKHWDHPSMVVVVYDITNETSFNSCTKWLERVRAQKPDVSFPGVLIANKMDLENRRLVSEKEGREFAESNGLEYFECSAKEMQGVEVPFVQLSKAWHQLYLEKVEQLKTLG